MAKTNIKSKKIIVLILMMLALATIYVLPYLRYTFYIPLQEAMNLVGENKKYGMLTSIYGIANFLLYIPGGWMADRFDPKKLMVFSMVSTGALDCGCLPGRATQRCCSSMRCLALQRF